MAKYIRELAHKISELDQNDPFRAEATVLLLEKLYQLGLIATKWDLANASKVSASSFCRRRLPVVMVRRKL